MREDAQGTQPTQEGYDSQPARRRIRLPHTAAADFGASLVVFLVAVPLSLGIAVASGAPLIAGIIAVVVGGIVAGAVGGSAIQVSGPAAGLTIIVADLVFTYGWGITCLITLLAGLVQIALGLFRVARAALAISPAVIHGMLAGIGITIALAQLHVVLGGAPQSSAIANIQELPGQIADNHGPAVMVGLVTIAVMLVWSRIPDLGRVRLRRVPSALVAVAAATGVAVFAGWQVERVNLPDSLASAWSGPALPETGQIHGVVIAVATVAMVASVESLLCAVAVDRLHDGRRVRLNRELFGQGAANATSGALGGLPVAGVIVRSTANARAGARTPLSTILHSVWTLLFVVLFASAVELIPMAALAGLLVYIGLQMVSLAHMRNLRKHHEVSVYLVTVAGVVGLGLLEGVLIGFALAVLVSLRRLTKVNVRTEERPGDKNEWHVVVQGSLTFLGVPQVTQVLRTIPTGAKVDLDLHVDFMDHAAFESIHAWRLDHERTGGRVDIDEAHENWYERNCTSTAPVAKTPSSSRSRWWAPWGMRQDGSSGESASGLLVAGAREYHSSTTEKMRTLMGRLSQRQRPAALFIACADARVVPNLITASGPGDLFTVRNVGNFVPRWEPGVSDDSVGSAVEYAVSVLEVPSIVVCGHSHCGAMRALIEGCPVRPGEADLSSVVRWLRHGAPSVTRLGTDRHGLPAAETVRRLAEANIVQQLEHLLSYPAVRERYEAGRLELTGMYFDLETAMVHVLDASTRQFVAVGGHRIPEQRVGGMEHQPQ
ncbi:bifunctional SulP family inorganic anion transporter/carbonic anhydrase [Nocardiopsis ansamitocini]|uniref:carbonic anhydrase n=1 Tax=Nocardiopsis ansamitocini TaxID=1670832 RepID=A0A9W6P7R3_9ACTN|nr:bifunctional SulP family inorganic anion transporter/carbonic anhydrase [Nocardiopsis ansamitocini]GLU49060.1 carbonic anhydrase [Nocardiopsis ansamitocini]